MKNKSYTTRNMICSIAFKININYVLKNFIVYGESIDHLLDTYGEINLK